MTLDILLLDTLATIDRYSNAWFIIYFNHDVLKMLIVCIGIAEELRSN